MTPHHIVSNNPPILFEKIHLLLESVNILSPTCSINKVEFQIRLHIETIMLCCYSSLSPLLPPPPLTACIREESNRFITPSRHRDSMILVITCY